MGLGASGAGSYGAVGDYSFRKLAKPAAGNSKLMPAKSTAALNSVAEAATRKFIANGRKMAQGAAGVSRINIKA